jgi:hypothetical protein
MSETVANFPKCKRVTIEFEGGSQLVFEGATLKGFDTGVNTSMLFSQGFVWHDLVLRFQFIGMAASFHRPFADRVKDFMAKLLKKNTPMENTNG